MARTTHILRMPSEIELAGLPPAFREYFKSLIVNLTGTAGGLVMYEENTGIGLETASTGLTGIWPDNAGWTGHFTNGILISLS